jgi:hypothetical protein
MFSCSGTHVRALCTQHECAESLKRDPKARIAVNLHVARNMVGGTYGCTAFSGSCSSRERKREVGFGTTPAVEASSEPF